MLLQTLLLFQVFYNKSLLNNFNVEVINGGVNGADSFDEIHLLNKKFLALNPDMIIVYDGGNDLYKPIRDDILQEPWPSDIDRLLKQIRNYYKTPQFVEFLDRIFKKNIYGDQGIPDEQVTNERMDAKAGIWKRRWNNVCEENNKKGIKTIITIQPYLGVGNKELSSWESEIKDRWSHIDVSDSFPLMIEKLNELDKSCSKIIDLTGVFDNNKGTIFYDLIHVGDVGNEIVAKKIFSNILPLIEK